MTSFQHIIRNIQTSTPPPRHLRVKGNGKPGQTFSPRRLEELCEKYGLDPCEVAIKGLSPEHTPDLKDKDRTDIALKMLEYLMPKKRAVDVDANLKGDLKVVIQRYSDTAPMEAEGLPTPDMGGT